MQSLQLEGSYRSPAFENAQVSEAMHPGVVSCTADTSLRTVARIMAERHIHSVVVDDLVAAQGPGWGWSRIWTCWAAPKATSKR